MKKGTIVNGIPSNREESLEMILENFISSDANTIRLALFPDEIPDLEEKYKEIIVHEGEYHPNGELSMYTVFKRPDYITI